MRRSDTTEAMVEALPEAGSSVATQVKRLDLEHGDIIVVRSQEILSAEVARRWQEEVLELARRHGARDVTVLVLDAGTDIEVLRAPQATDEPRMTPFGCSEAPWRVQADAVTSASISEAFGALPSI